MYTENNNKKQHEIQMPDSPYRMIDYDGHLLRQLNVSTPAIAIGTATEPMTKQDTNMLQNIAGFIAIQFFIRLLLRIIARR